VSRQTTGSTSGLGAVEGGPLTVVAGLALLVNVAGLYAFPGVALCVFGYVALTLVLAARAERSVKNPRSAAAGNAVMILSWVVALVGGALVGAFHWVQYAHAAYAVLGLYASAALIWLAGRAFSALWCWLFPAAGAALLAAVVHLGAPPGADDMGKKDSWTPLLVTAVDEAGRPIDGATVYLDLVKFWQGDPALDGERAWWSKDRTGGDGTAVMALHEDPRFKRLVIRVRREPVADGFNGPATIGHCVGYADARVQAVLPAPKVPYAFRVVMARRPHPDVAVLAVELESPGSRDDVVGRGIRVALTAAPPSYEGGRTSDRGDVDDGGRVRDVYLRGSQRLVFKIGRDLAARPLALRVLERDGTRYDDAYLELKRVRIDALALGDERTLPTLTLPGRTSASGPETAAEAHRDTAGR
jgi:hypothetical protein